MEIERKFLIKNIPDNLKSNINFEIEQAYLADSPVVRIRKRISDDKEEYFLTVKSSGMLAREEVETLITKSAYNNFKLEAKGNVITKQRYILPISDGLKAELDIFNGVFKGVVMVEVEFPDEEASKKFTPPDYFADEVTFDSRFHNSRMSSMSKEEISDLIGFVHSKSSC